MEGDKNYNQNRIPNECNDEIKKKRSRMGKGAKQRNFEKFRERKNRHFEDARLFNLRLKLGLIDNDGNEIKFDDPTYMTYSTIDEDILPDEFICIKDDKVLVDNNGNNDVINDNVVNSREIFTDDLGSSSKDSTTVEEIVTSIDSLTIEKTINLDEPSVPTYTSTDLLITVLDVNESTTIDIVATTKNKIYNAYYIGQSEDDYFQLESRSCIIQCSTTEGKNKNDFPVLCWNCEANWTPDRDASPCTHQEIDRLEACSLLSIIKINYSACESEQSTSSSVVPTTSDVQYRSIDEVSQVGQLPYGFNSQIENVITIRSTKHNGVYTYRAKLPLAFLIHYLISCIYISTKRDKINLRRMKYHKKSDDVLP